MAAASADGPTIGHLLRKAALALQGAAVPAPRLTAEALLATAVGRDRAWLFAHSSDELESSASERFQAMLERRLSHEPTHYITGVREFYGREFEVGPAALTPRPETELLVEEALSAAPPQALAADVGCGAGVIAVSLAAERPDLRIVATDLSREALGLTSRNVRRHASGRVALLEADLTKPFRPSSLDVLVCNPPYVPERDRPSLPPELTYEPALALYGGLDGLAVYRRLIPAASAALRPGGRLLLEIGYGQLAAVDGLCEAAGFARIRAAEDLQGIPRAILAIRPS